MAINSFPIETATVDLESVTENVALAEQYKDDAKAAKDSAEVSATNAANSKSNAATSESNAATSEANASASASAAATSESNAAASESNAATSESNAAISETNAAASASDAEDASDASAVSANLAQAWAEGTEPGGTGTKSAKEWADEAASGASVEGVLLAANNLSDLVNSATARTNLGLGTAATKATGTAPGEVPLNSDLGTMATETAVDYVPQSAKATTLEAQAGVNDIKWMTPARTFDAVRELTIGEGQEWSSESANRANQTVYQNTTGRTMVVGISLSRDSTFQVSKDQIDWIVVTDVGGSYSDSTSFVIIPPDYYYKVSKGTFRNWVELR